MDIHTLQQIALGIVGFCFGTGLAYWLDQRRISKATVVLPIPITHLILAGNAQQYRYYAQRNFSVHDKTRYVSNLRDIQGYHEHAQLHMVGTYYERSDYREIINYARATGINTPDIPEEV